MNKRKLIYGALLASLVLIACSKSNQQQVSSFESIQMNQLPSGVQAVNIPTGTAPTNVGSAKLPLSGIVAIKSTWIRYNTQLNSNIAVLGTCNGVHNADACLDSGRELVIGVNVPVPTVNTGNGNRVRVKARANVQGQYGANDFSIAKNAQVPNKSTIAGLPELPYFLKGTPGATNLLESTAALVAGQYANLKIRKNAAQTLAGGFYQFGSIDIMAGGKLYCAASAKCVVTVKGQLNARKGAIIQALSNDPNDFTIYGEKANANQTESAAVLLAANGQVTANIFAGYGQLRLGNATVSRGILIGRWVYIGGNSIVYGGALRAGVISKLIEANVGGVVEIPGEAKLTIPANALEEDTIITLTKATAPATLTWPRGVKTHSAAYDFQPSGLTFALPCSLAIDYNASDVAAAGANPQTTTILSSRDNQIFATESTMLTANLATAQIRHFTYFLVGSQPNGTAFSDVQISGTLAYVTDRAFGLRIFDLSALPAITPLGSAQTAITGYLYAGKKVGNYFYQVVDSLVYVVDVTNPNVLPPVVTYPAPGIGGVNGIVVSGNSLIVLNNSLPTPGFCTFDITNPGVPSLPTCYATTDFPFAATVDSGYLYVTELGDIVEAFDLSNLAASPILNIVPGTGSVLVAIAIKAGFVYAQELSANLIVAPVAAGVINGPAAFSGPTGGAPSSINVDTAELLVGKLNGGSIALSGLAVDTALQTISEVQSVNMPGVPNTEALWRIATTVLSGQTYAIIAAGSTSGGAGSLQVVNVNAPAPAWYVNDTFTGATYYNMCEDQLGNLYVLGSFQTATQNQYFIRTSNGTGAPWNFNMAAAFIVPRNDSPAKIACDQTGNIYLMVRNGSNAEVWKSNTTFPMVFGQVDTQPTVYYNDILVNPANEVIVIGHKMVGLLTDLIVRKSDNTGMLFTDFYQFNLGVGSSSGESGVLDASGNLYITNKSADFSAYSNFHLTVHKYNGTIWSMIDDFQPPAGYYHKGNPYPIHISSGKLMVGGTMRDLSTNLGIWFIRECSLVTCAIGNWVNNDNWGFDNRTPDYGMADFGVDQAGGQWSNGISFTIPGALYFISKYRAPATIPWIDALAQTGDRRSGTYFKSSSNRFFRTGFDFTSGVFSGIVQEYR